MSTKENGTVPEINVDLAPGNLHMMSIMIQVTCSIPVVDRELSMSESGKASLSK